MNNLPIWNYPGTLPAFQDTESLTALEATAKVYAAMRKLIEEYNEFERTAKETYKEFSERMEKYLVDTIGEVATKQLLKGLEDGSIKLPTDTGLSVSGKAADAKATGDAINRERERINNLARLENGSTTGDAELMDIRSGANGKNYSSAGEAVREQFEQVTEAHETAKNAAMGAPVVVFENGGIETNGEAVDKSNRIRSNFVKVVKGSAVSIKGSQAYKFGVAEYGDNTESTFIYYRALSLDKYVAPYDCYIRIVMAPNSSDPNATCSLGAENTLDLSLYAFSVDRAAPLYEELSGWSSGYIKNNEYDPGDCVGLYAQSTTSWRYQIVECNVGDEFILYGSGGAAPRLWAFVDTGNRLVSIAEEGAKAIDLHIVAPVDGKLIVNCARDKHHKLSVKSVCSEKMHESIKIVPCSMPTTACCVESVKANEGEHLLLDELYLHYDALAEQHSEYITKTILGKDASGSYNVYRYDFCPPVPVMDGVVPADFHSYEKTDYPVVIMDACIHGSEKPCARALFNFMEKVANDTDGIFAWMRNNIHFVIVPVSNPWGYVNNARSNANGVDLNRNFSIYWEYGEDNTDNDRYRGKSALSETETQYLDAILNEYKDKCAFYYNWHTHGLFTGYSAMTCFSIPRAKFVDDMQKIAMGVIKSVTESGWENHDLPRNSGYIGMMQINGAYGSACNTGAFYGIPSASPEVAYRYYDGNDDADYSENVNCFNVEYILCAVADSCEHFLLNAERG